MFLFYLGLTGESVLNPSFSPPFLFLPLSLSILPFRDLRSIYIPTVFHEYTYPLEFWWLNSTHRFYFLETPLWVLPLFTVWAGAPQVHFTVSIQRIWAPSRTNHTYTCMHRHAHRNIEIFSWNFRSMGHKGLNHTNDTGLRIPIISNLWFQS